MKPASDGVCLGRTARCVAPGLGFRKFKMQLPTRQTVPSLVTLQHFRDIPEALLAKGKLESAGIDCLLADGNLVRMDWLLSNAIGGIRLQVDQQDLESARAVLAEPIPPEFGEADVGEPFAQPRCPRCCSLDIGFEKIDRFWTYGLWLLLSFPIPISKDNWKCYTCGIEWAGE